MEQYDMDEFKASDEQSNVQNEESNGEEGIEDKEVILDETTGVQNEEGKGSDDTEDQETVHDGGTELQDQRNNQKEDMHDLEDGLLKALLECNEEDVCSLIQQGVNLNKQYENNKTALMIAVEQGQSEIVDILLSNGAKVNVQDENGWTPLMIAARDGHKNIVDVLIENGADVKVEAEKDGETALTSTRKEVLIINFVQTRCGDALSSKTRFLKHEHIKTLLGSAGPMKTHKNLDLVAIIEKACPEQTFTAEEKEMMEKFWQVPESEYKAIRKQLLANGAYDATTIKNNYTRYVLQVRSYLLHWKFCCLYTGVCSFC